MIVKITDREYERLSRCLSEKFPDVKLNLLNSDTNLMKLGFTDYIPYTVEIYASDEQINAIMDYAINLETEVYANDDAKRHPLYEEYKKYGWLFDFFFNVDLTT